VCQVHEERLRDSDSDDSAPDSVDGSPPSQSAGFFLTTVEYPDSTLSPTDPESMCPADLDSTPADDDGSAPEPSPTVRTDEPVEPGVQRSEIADDPVALKDHVNSSGLMSIFTTAVTIETMEQMECEVDSMSCDSMADDEAPKRKISSGSIPSRKISSGSIPSRKTSTGSVGSRKTSGSLPVTKHVELVELIAQMCADDERA